MQAEEELKDRSAEHETATEEFNSALEKTEQYMKNVRQQNGQEWDGLRTKSRYNLEQLKHKVGHFRLYRR